MRAIPVRLTILITVLSLLFSLSYSGCQGDTPASPEPQGGLKSINVFNVPPTLRPGQVHLLGATGIYVGTATYNITGLANWSSDNTDVIEIIGKGILRAVGGGTATITASYKGVTSGQYKITVDGPPIPGSEGPPTNDLEEITIEPTFVQVPEGDTVQFEATAHFTFGNTQLITNLVDWRVSDDDPGFIIDADNSNAWGQFFGLFRATGPVGSTSVSAEYQGLISNYSTVIVKDSHYGTSYDGGSVIYDPAYKDAFETAE
ncbi:MAG TPA: hypothetical protein VGB30_06820 [bacterium]|jgi:hypothetical protein